MGKNNQQFKIMDTKLSQQKDSLKQVFLTILLAIGIACVFIIPVASYLVQQNYNNTVKNISESMQTRAIAKFHILESQFNALFDYSNSIVNSDTFKLLITDYSINPENEIFNAQKPYINRTIKEFVEFNKEIVSATLTSNNDTLAQHNTYEFINNDKTDLVFKDNKAISSFILNNDKIFVDVAVNITDLNHSKESKVVGQLVYRLNITDRINKVLSKNSNSLEGSSIVLVDVNNQSIELNKAKIEIANHTFSKTYFNTQHKLIQTADLNDIAFITPLKTFGYKIEFLYSKKAALKQHTIFKSNAFAYGALFAAVVTLFMLAIFWKGKNKQTRQLAKQYATFAKEINKKQTMLESINKTIDEHITLKDLNGKYVYANKAFMSFFNITDNLRKLKLDTFLKTKTLQDTLHKADKQVAKSSQPWSKDQVSVTNNDGTRYFDITKWPQKDGENVTGIITIARDRTDSILHQKQMEKLQNQAINALVHTVEIKDPHLAGHHARLAYIATEIAKKLNLNEDDKLTLDYSARLSGIGKVFVPQALLTKPGKLTTDELEIIQTHVVRAKEVLNNIDFSLPITDTITNMYERLDGSGYPNALTAEHIGQLSRILAISDAFCALIVPRSYREAIDFNQAVKFLQSQHGKYDTDILLVLEEIVSKLSSVKKEFIINLS